MANFLHRNRIQTIPGTALRKAALRALWLPFLFVALTCVAWQSHAQTVSHPVSEMTSAARHYSYTYMLSATEKKELEYIIVKASNGDIKTVFNACDVCYSAHKGYSQSGTELRCNNCGNRFAIDALGGTSTGGTCNPGYLPHTIQGDNVVINVADLVVGEYFFLTQTVTGIEADVTVPGITLATQGRQMLTVTLPGEGHRTFHIFTLNGQLRRSFTNSSRIVQISIAEFTPGAYVLVTEEARKLTNNVFLVY
ncbi:MAG: DUF2318 domain-containing protein [Bacteroidota bacterium]|jgi:hypothetical protein